MKRLCARRVGFTLVELLVVIAIITVLIAIALPVFSRVREKARQTACMANLHQIAMAVRMYRMDMGQYPGPYDPAVGEGGLNALYPSYITDRKALICSDDLIDSVEKYIEQAVQIWEDADTYREVPYRQLLETANTLYLWEDRPAYFIEHYSSYNDPYNWVGYVADPAEYSLCDLGSQYLKWGDNLAFWYAWYRWDPEAGTEHELGVWRSADVFDQVDYYLHYHLAQQTYWPGYDPWNLEEGNRLQDNLHRGLWDPGNPESSSYDYMPYGMPSPVFPGLINRNAPDNAIVTRCVHHRPYTVVRTPIRGSGGGSRGGRRGTRGGPPSYETEIVYGESPRDIVLRLDGSAEFVVGLNYDWAVQSPQTH